MAANPHPHEVGAVFQCEGAKVEADPC
jgi:hypothetical protein